MPGFYVKQTRKAEVQVCDKIKLPNIVKEENEEDFDIIEYISYDLLKTAIKIGMNEEQYWYRNPRLFTIYFDNYMEKQQEKYDWVDILSHDVGLYVLSAIKSTPLISMPILDKIDSSKYKKMFIPYPEKPNIIMAKEKEEKLNKLKKEAESNILLKPASGSKMSAEEIEEMDKMFFNKE